ncbi:MAG: hypothetical protein NVS2B14_17550 [Chamaesiphon sp.]
MTKVPGVKYKEVGNLYGLRNWVEYGLKQSKNSLGWADFRVTNYAQIQKWWEDEFMNVERFSSPCLSQLSYFLVPRVMKER